MSDWTPEAGTPPVSPPEDVSTPEEPDLPQDGPVADAPSFEPAEPAPLGVERTPTGRAEVDALLERLADADHLPADGHTEVYEDVHRGLKDALTSLDTRPAGDARPAAAPGPPRPGPTPAYDNTHDHRS
ncbi:hypothetical protein ACG93S_25920 [Streptomyces sp. WAC01490]|uniref:hypothetical protein n=1 Tax=unclassified Streptomyces TaxID=2593676 RepID=UPI003F404107